MKIKQSPDDFIVEELTTLTPLSDGPFGLYRLRKTGWTTPDALNLVCRRWKLPWQRLSYGGLKDRHAMTTQYFTVANGPARGINQQNILVEYLGRAAEPYDSSFIKANRFRLVVRDLRDDETNAAQAKATAIRHVGIPNYFDDQRFGSVSAAGHFIARHLVLGDFESGLKQALTSAYAFDRAEAKREKAILRQHWRDWPTCKSKLDRGNARSVIDYLVTHPDDFRGAFGRIRPELGELYLSAYQSHLWNRTLAGWIRSKVSGSSLGSIELRTGPLPVPQSVPATLLPDWFGLNIPLPSARMTWDAEASWAPAMQAVLNAEGITLEQMKLKGLRRPYFSKGERAAVYRPEGFSLIADDDDRNFGERKLTLQFELPRGSYATMLVKCLLGTSEGLD